MCHFMGSLVLQFGKNMGFAPARYIILAKQFLWSSFFCKTKKKHIFAQAIAKVIVQQNIFL